jgi:hypothetical protein
MFQVRHSRTTTRYHVVWLRTEAPPCPTIAARGPVLCEEVSAYHARKHIRKSIRKRARGLRATVDK